MKIFAISGLGADKRIFDYLTIQHELVAIDWLIPEKNEDIVVYTERLINAYKINEEVEFGILGVSFGGLIAVEMSKLLNPKMTILISSVETHHEFGWLIKLIGKSKIIKFIPKILLDPPRFLAHYMFGTKRKKLLTSILNDTDLRVTKWAVRELLYWKNETKLPNLIKIGSLDDKILPSKGSDTILIDKGEHFMIVDRSDEISDILNHKIELFNHLRNS
jgi:hypothetical protein